MGRLSSPPPRLTSAPPRLLTAIPDDAAKERERTAFNPLRKLYKTARWAKLRWSILLRDRFICQMCGRLEHDTSKLVADHKKPHRGDLSRFWDEGNLECLCSHCHSGAKQRLEQQADYR